MRFLLILVGIVALLFLGAWALGIVDLRQTQTARVPEVKVEGGQAPKFDVDVAKVEMGTETRTVDVPKVETEKKHIEVPVVRVAKPANGQDASE